MCERHLMVFLLVWAFSFSDFVQPKLERRERKKTAASFFFVSQASLFSSSIRMAVCSSIHTGI